MGQLSALVFLPPDLPTREPTRQYLDLIQSLDQALDLWRSNPAHVFELPLTICGTPFQRNTWRAISQIPAGEIRTYGDISAEIGGTPRAVGQACGANPFPIVIPCHRVVAKSGLGGFANTRDGWLLDTKRWLLKHEGVL